MSVNDSMGSEARRTGPLTDDELASLLGDKISQEERAELNARLENDPAGSEVLAMAASVEDDQSGGGLDKGKVDELLKMVNDGLAIEDICEHCGGDLHPGGKFCPHCGVNQLEKSVKCFKCGTTVIEGSYYCFKCGNVLKQVKGRRDPGMFILVVGLGSLLCSFLFWPILMYVAVLLLIFGSILIGSFITLLWYRYEDKRIASELKEGRFDADDRSKKTGT
jgi:hypothetical protein